LSGFDGFFRLMFTMNTQPGDLLLIPEVARIARVSEETVRFWIKRRRLPSLRPGRRRLVRRDVLEAFLAASRRR
jgi:excisionase family DNA binding protein